MRVSLISTSSQDPNIFSRDISQTQCRIKLLGALCQTQMGGPGPLSLPSPYPFCIPNSLPFKVGFGTYRHNDDKCTHTDYIVPRTHRKLGERAFSVAAPKAWNRLPTKLKTSTCSTDSFKRSLKTFLFQSVYGCETRVS